jgi:SAM-dependent methyltransferase
MRARADDMADGAQRPPRGAGHHVSDASALTNVYRRRFEDSHDVDRRGVWTEVGRYLQRYIPPGGRVLDIGSDAGLLIASVEAGEKIATDLRDMSSRMPAGVRFVQANSLELLDVLPRAHFDAILISNFLEHLPSGDAVIDQLRIAFELLRPGGRVIVLQPNIRLTGVAHWDFIDHKTPLTERSLLEAATSVGFTPYAMVKRFLPYTTKSRLPQRQWMVRLYLRVPPVWLLMGKQTLFVGSKPDN